MPARYGGEEFVVVATATSIQAAAGFAERLRANICSKPMRIHGEALEITASFGVADNDGCDSPEDLIQAADEALYRAKEAGRNCVKSRQEGLQEPTDPEATT